MSASCVVCPPRTVAFSLFQAFFSFLLPHVFLECHCASCVPPSLHGGHIVRVCIFMLGSTLLHGACMLLRMFGSAVAAISFLLTMLFLLALYFDFFRCCCPSLLRVQLSRALPLCVPPRARRSFKRESLLCGVLSACALRVFLVASTKCIVAVCVCCSRRVSSPAFFAPRCLTAFFVLLSCAGCAVLRCDWRLCVALGAVCARGRCHCRGRALPLRALVAPPARSACYAGYPISSFRLCIVSADRSASAFRCCVFSRRTAWPALVARACPFSHRRARLTLCAGPSLLVAFFLFVPRGVAFLLVVACAARAPLADKPSFRVAALLGGEKCCGGGRGPPDWCAVQCAARCCVARVCFWVPPLCARMARAVRFPRLIFFCALRLRVLCGPRVLGVCWFRFFVFLCVRCLSALAVRRAVLRCLPVAARVGCRRVHGGEQA
ncbi:hypothetical protein TRVL_03520 [Trypanosoma vivax]|nr:hypothetical protein TRVL_03520 [Trypanosoma vivax]